MPGPGGVPGLGEAWSGGFAPGRVPSTGGGAWSRGVCSRGGGTWWRLPRAATAAGGTHPTGMHSCYDLFFIFINSFPFRSFQ